MFCFVKGSSQTAQSSSLVAALVEVPHHGGKNVWRGGRRVESRLAAWAAFVMEPVDLDTRIGDAPPCSTAQNIAGAAATTGGSGLVFSYMAWHQTKAPSEAGYLGRRLGAVGLVQACASMAGMKITKAAQACDTR